MAVHCTKTRAFRRDQTTDPFEGSFITTSTKAPNWLISYCGCFTVSSAWSCTGLDSLHLQHIFILFYLLESVALLVARRTNNQPTIGRLWVQGLLK